MLCPRRPSALLERLPSSCMWLILHPVQHFPPPDILLKFEVWVNASARLCRNIYHGALVPQSPPNPKYGEGKKPRLKESGMCERTWRAVRSPRTPAQDFLTTGWAMFNVLQRPKYYFELCVLVKSSVILKGTLSVYLSDVGTDTTDTQERAYLSKRRQSSTTENCESLFLCHIYNLMKLS